MYLTNAEIDSCRDVFMKYDTDNSGSIDVTELRYVMDDMGHRVSDEDLFLMLTSVDDNGSGGIEFAEFLRLVVSNKQQSAERASEADTVDAFIALGGKDDKSGIVKTEKLKKVIKDFGLLVDVDDLLVENNLPPSEFIDYNEFKQILGYSE
eukprot:CAMPEP_0114256534 /NCGR_PEP_ID=MMETSP0058-20121206/18212_1 /TAXON_ID=36894 /ORGANISM="Pyramimonas parkeae, CCMP726" /LENGTH=150 /DNA_ID=CAMNT_0001371123 /DNA_START=529 /DNA_END=981 /DNA_ORIENTATION=+